MYDLEYGEPITVMDLTDDGRIEPRVAYVSAPVGDLWTYRLAGDVYPQLLIGLEGFRWLRGHGGEIERALIAANALA